MSLHGKIHKENVIAVKIMKKWLAVKHHCLSSIHVSVITYSAHSK